MSENKSTTAVVEKPSDPTPTERPAETVLAKREPQSGEITRADVFHAKLETWQKRGLNVITPLTSFSSLAPQHTLIYTVVPIVPDPESAVKDVYYNKFFCDPNEVALSAIGLSKISRAAGISIRTVRTSPYTIQHFWEFRATATWKGVDGLEELQEAHAEFDLREGADRLKGFSAAQIGQFRTHGMSHCESRAIARVIRKYGALKGKYKRQELAQPFVIVRVMFKVDVSDPHQRQMLVERGMASSMALYPSRELPAAQTIDAELVDRERPRGAEAGGDQSTNAPASTVDAADPPKPPTPTARRIVKVEESSGVNPTTKKAWKRFTVVLDDGTFASTFSETLAKTAREIAASGEWCDVHTEMKGEYENVTAIEKPQPPLEGLSADDGY